MLAAFIDGHKSPITDLCEKARQNHSDDNRIALQARKALDIMADHQKSGDRLNPRIASALLCVLKGGGSLDSDTARLTQLCCDVIETRNTLVEHNMRLAVSWGKKYAALAVERGDVYQMANLGLIRAAELFDGTRGYRFTTYATYWIRQAIERGRTHDSFLMPIPRYLSGAIGPLKTLLASNPELARDVNTLSQRLGRPPEQIQQLLERVDVLLANDEQWQIIDSQAKQDDELDPTLTTSDVANLLGKLDDRERKVLTLRFGLPDEEYGEYQEPKTLEEVGRTLKLTREAIRQIQKKALAKLAKFV